MKFLILFLLFLYPITNHGQTCIIVVKTKNSITVCADSRVSKTTILELNGKVWYDTIWQNKCKILFDGSSYYSFAGSYVPQLLIDLFDSVSQEKTIADKVKRYSELANPLVGKELIQLAKSNRKEFDHTIRNSPKFSCVFYGFENGEPILTSFEFLVESTGFNFKINHSVTANKKISKDSIQYKAFGHTSAWDHLTDKQLYDTLNNKDRRKIMLKLIEAQAIKTPMSVGKPFSLLELKRNMEKWWNKESCTNSGTK